MHHAQWMPEPHEFFHEYACILQTIVLQSSPPGSKTAFRRDRACRLLLRGKRGFAIRIEGRVRVKSEMERELVEGCRRQDRSAQRQLYDLTSEKIYRLMLRMTHNADDAFDLTQDAYVRAFTQIDQFDGRSSVATWVYRIAVNQALQFLRRTRTGRKKLDVVRQTASASIDDQRHITQIDVRGALATLDPDEQAILLLRYHEGHSYQEIADVLGCAEGTVASRLNRARQKLKDRLSTSYGPSEENTPAGHPNRRETEVSAGWHGAGTESDRLRW